MSTVPAQKSAGSSTWSIAARITALITVSGFGILLAGGLFLYWTLARSLQDETARFLADKVFVLRAVIHDRPHDMAAFDEETRLEGAARRFSRYYVRVLNERGQLVVETPEMSQLVDLTAFEALTPADGNTEEPHEVRLGSQTVALLAATAPTTAGELWHVQLALDVSNKAALLASYRRNLLFVLLAGLAVSALAGYAIARRGLAPLESITRSARAISAANLDRRISSQAWPKELTALADAFDQMLERLEDSFRRLSQFSADIAHELRTPVTNFLTESQVTLSQPRSVDDYRQVLESGIEEFGSLARMIDSLLFLARADQVDGRLERVELDARKEIENVMEFHRANAEENGVTLACEGNACLQANSILFQRAISNLLSNAVRHTSATGQVTIRITTADGGATSISVRDSGSGIAPEHLPHLFDRFYRADASRSQRTGGFGLGLALVQSIMALHGGAARVVSEVGQGTEVTLTFPGNAAS
ncbi:heavy metal sensor histidine kinase [Steroidobacter cummioxidans]|uniref:heavy metal sensor histidine kinase n=1 Tax=Steroidobacter cummioxidans TaxID=1803913 RepID=UPI000E31B22C|nr:heavy metal sensor histidine kinase [Steroidobacter cummioxidans]